MHIFVRMTGTPRQSPIALRTMQDTSSICVCLLGCDLLRRIRMWLNFCIYPVLRWQPPALVAIVIQFIISLEKSYAPRGGCGIRCRMSASYNAHYVQLEIAAVATLCDILVCSTFVVASSPSMKISVDSPIAADQFCACLVQVVRSQTTNATHPRL